jgi:hypothetical protein
VNRYSETLVFVRAVADGGFSAAARSLSLTPSAVSKLVTRMENRLGVLLFDRSHRSVTLTPEGTRLGFCVAEYRSNGGTRCFRAIRVLRGALGRLQHLVQRRPLRLLHHDVAVHLQLLRQHVGTLAKPTPAEPFIRHTVIESGRDPTRSSSCVILCSRLNVSSA